MKFRRETATASDRGSPSKHRLLGVACRPARLGQPPVTETGLGCYPRWTGGVVAEFFAKLADVEAKIIRLCAVAGSPNFLQKQSMSHELAGICRHRNKQTIFGRGEVKCLSIDRYEPPRKVDRKRVESQDRRFVGIGRFSPQHRAHAGQ